MILTKAMPALQETLTRLGALDHFLAAEIGPLEAGWFRAADLLRPDPPHLDEGLAWSVRRYPKAEHRVRGSFFIGNYAWYLAAAAIGCYLAERRVPDLAAENIALRYSTFTWREEGESGEAERFEVRFLSPRFAALPTDPAAGQPDILIISNEADLHTWLRLRLETHLAPLIQAIAHRTHLGQRAQWNLAADTFASLFQHAGASLGDEARGRKEGLAFVKAAGSPLRNPGTGYLTLEYQGHCETFRARGGCCLYYRAGETGEKCATCVLRPEAERYQRLLDYMARKYIS
ncbi:MAG: ferric iron reductase [Anaerolineae bacterium]|nr:ferric iron reductase [Anaerolineae bacterium]